MTLEGVLACFADDAEIFDPMFDAGSWANVRCGCFMSRWLCEPDWTSPY
jgi:hypothetical protein